MRRFYLGWQILQTASAKLTELSDLLGQFPLPWSHYVLKFLDLKDEYSEADLEEALIAHLETFLLELGGDFAFIGRQRRLRIGDQ